MTLEELRPSLVCPRCRSPIELDSGGGKCAHPACGLSAPGAFPVVNGRPVLVDFSSSILDRERLVGSGGASDVARAAPRGWRRTLHRLYAAPNRVAERHAAALLDAMAGASERPMLLIVGGGTMGSGAGPLYDDPRIRVAAFDIYASPLTQFVADAHFIPLQSGSADAVWVQAVLEHVLDPWRVVAEIERVLSPSGYIYAETPFMQQVHEGPFDFTRFTESGHRWLFRRFECLDSGVTAGLGTQLLWSFDHAVRGFTRSRAAGRAARAALFWLQWLDGLASPAATVDGASCVHFYGRRWDRELAPREMVAHYRGAQWPGR